MVTIDVDPILVHVGPLMLSWYGLVIAVAMLVGVWLTLREARRRGIPTEPVMDLALWIFVGAIAGVAVAIVWALLAQRGQVPARGSKVSA